MIQTQDLCKSYGSHQVLCDITLSLQRGKIHGFIGRNGSGKTVLFKILCGLTRPTKGIVQIDGHELGKEMEIPPSLGAIINVPGFMPHMSGWRNLVLLASIRKSCSNEDIRHAIDLGITKINIHTELCEAAMDAIHACPPDERYQGLNIKVRDAVQARAEEKIRLFGSNGKAQGWYEK